MYPAPSKVTFSTKTAPDKSAHFTICSANSKGLRFGNFVQMRDIMYDTLEAIFAEKETAQQGLDDAVSKGNKLLRKFEQANK